MNAGPPMAFEVALLAEARASNPSARFVAVRLQGVGLTAVYQSRPGPTAYYLDGNGERNWVWPVLVNGDGTASRAGDEKAWTLA